jgi:hypothetical protein
MDDKAMADKVEGAGQAGVSLPAITSAMRIAGGAVLYDRYPETGFYTSRGLAADVFRAMISADQASVSPLQEPQLASDN